MNPLSPQQVSLPSSHCFITHFSSENRWRRVGVDEKKMTGVSLPDEGSSSHGAKHVVVVMDGMKDFTVEPLKWALQNIVSPGCTVTLLGVMPWLNIPLSVKTWLDVWSMEFENLQDNSERQSDSRYLKLQEIIELCKIYGVVPHKEAIMGYPKRLVVAEKITSLGATWAVFDRHHRKNSEFYAERVPCNVVMMKENGETNIFRHSRY